MPGIQSAGEIVVIAPLLDQDLCLFERIEHITVTPLLKRFEIDFHGELGLNLGSLGQKTERPGWDCHGRSLSVVAGVGFEPTTFRL